MESPDGYHRDCWRPLIIGNSILVNRDSCLVECLISVFAGNIFVGKVNEHEMIVCSARNNTEPSFDKFSSQRLRIFDNPLLI